MFCSWCSLARPSLRKALDAYPPRKRYLHGCWDEEGDGRYVEAHARRVRSDISHGRDSRVSYQDASIILWYACSTSRMAWIRASNDDEYRRLGWWREEMDVHEDRRIERLPTSRTRRDGICARYVDDVKIAFFIFSLYLYYGNHTRLDVDRHHDNRIFLYRWRMARGNLGKTLWENPSWRKGTQWCWDEKSVRRNVEIHDTRDSHHTRHDHDTWFSPEDASWHVRYASRISSMARVCPPYYHEHSHLGWW